MELVKCATAIPSHYELQIGIKDCVEWTDNEFYPNANVDRSETFIIDLIELTKFITGSYKRGQPKMFIKNKMIYYGKMTKIYEGRMIMIYDTDMEPIYFANWSELEEFMNTGKGFDLYRIVQG